MTLEAPPARTPSTTSARSTRPAGDAPQIVDLRTRVVGDEPAPADIGRRTREVIGDQLARFAELREQLVCETILPY